MGGGAAAAVAAAAQLGNTETDDTDTYLNIAAICGSIGAALAFIIIAIVAVLIARKRYKVKKQDKSREKCIQHTQAEPDTGTIIQNDLYGDIPGNVDNKKLLSVNPRKEQATVYENVTFQADQSDDVCQPYYNPAERHQNEDRLVYTTIHFSEDQSKKAVKDPPKHERTEYATIVVNKVGVTT